MKRGVKICVQGELKDVAKFGDYVRQSAQELDLQGIAQQQESNNFVIYVVGESENIEDLIDCIYDSDEKDGIQDILVSPMDSTRDFRGVFRFITNV